MKKITFLLICLICSNLYSQTWREVFSGISNNFKSVVFVNSNTGYVFGEQIYLTTTNGGSNWQQHPFPYKISSATFTNQLTGYAIGRSVSEHDTNVVLKTTDGGLNWSKYYMQTINDQEKVKFADQNTGYIYSDDINQIKRTTNAGISWISIANPVPSGFSDFDAKQNILMGSYSVYVGGVGYQPRVAWSTNRGVSWNFYGFTSQNNELGKVVSIIDSVTYYFGSDNLFLTTDKGNNWNQVNPPFTYVSLYNLKFMDLNNGYRSYGDNNNSTISRTTDGGRNWATVTVSTPRVTDVTFINSLTGFAVADYGVVLKTTNGGQPISINTISTEIPNSFEVYQNFPNPFNPSTKINFQLTHSDFVKLQIYNSNGREVQSLINIKLAPGGYSFDFYGDNLPSGVYYYRLSAGNFTDTKKMILLK